MNQKIGLIYSLTKTLMIEIPKQIFLTQANTIQEKTS